MPRIRPVSDLRNHFAEITREVQADNEPVFLTKNGVGAIAGTAPWSIPLFGTGTVGPAVRFNSRSLFTVLRKYSSMCSSPLSYLLRCHASQYQTRALYP